MNERIKKLLEKATVVTYHGPMLGDVVNVDQEKFAESIVEECVENFAKVWYEQGLDIRGAEIGKFMKRFNEHFGVK